jgi:hypothetical protein
MSEFFRTAIYTKNIPAAERTLRLAAAVGAGVLAGVYFNEPWLRWVGAASAIMFALTGLFGFCPACYLAGRRLKNNAGS